MCETKPPVALVKPSPLREICVEKSFFAMSLQVAMNASPSRRGMHDSHVETVGNGDTALRMLSDMN